MQNLFIAALCPFACPLEDNLYDDIPSITKGRDILYSSSKTCDAPFHGEQEAARLCDCPIHLPVIIEMFCSIASGVNPPTLTALMTPSLLMKMWVGMP